MGAPIIENDEWDRLKQGNIILRKQLADAWNAIDKLVETANRAAAEIREGVRA